MNNEVTIPWGSIAEGAPASFAKVERMRHYVTRYGQFDADSCALFVASDGAQGEGLQFDPQSWGLVKSRDGMRWTLAGLFQPSRPGHPVPGQVAIATPFSFARPRYRDMFDEADIDSADRGDPMQCLPQLKQITEECQGLSGALARTCIDPQKRGRLSGQLRELVGALALGVGRCRLFGVAPGELDFTLSTPAFDAASARLIEKLSVVIRWAGRTSRTHATATPEANRETALRLLEIRMDVHAAYLALDEAYAAARDEGAVESDAMGRRLHQVRRMINLLDGNLQKQLSRLRLAASTRLLENWRRLLAPAYRQLLPWWLDGCLE